MNFMANGKKSGFTIPELLIVAAILGSLATISLVTYGGSQRRSRDTQRINDLSQYRASLESVASRNNGLYPRRSETSGVETGVLCVDLGYNVTDCPSDPRAGTSACNNNNCGYFYQSSNSCGTSPGDLCATRYVLWAALEQPEGDAEYWFTCSTGRSGSVAAGSIPPSDGVCP